MERSGQRGRKSRYNYVIKEGVGGQWDRKDGRRRCSHFSFSSSEAQAGLAATQITAYHLVYGELHSSVCLRKQAGTGYGGKG